ncbi:MAG: hypothetical protein GY841_16750, partial [FCB group bacterium]|nr:hypothetical protein [FCB group bacterium]
MPTKTATVSGEIMLVRTTLLFLILLVLSTPAIAQTWEQTNGPYADGRNVRALVVNVSGDLFAGAVSSV